MSEIELIDKITLELDNIKKCKVIKGNLDNIISIENIINFATELKNKWRKRNEHIIWLKKQAFEYHHNMQNSKTEDEKNYNRNKYRVYLDQIEKYH